MKLVQRIALVLLLIVGMFGCTLDLPTPTSASVERFENGAPIQSWSLTDSQLDALVSWFKECESGWSPSYITYVPKIEVRVKHRSGNQSSINIWPQKIIVNLGGNQFEQSFEASTVQGLLSALGAISG